MPREAFQLPIAIDLAATFLFGLTGALAAMRRGYDVVGLFALAFVTAVGGGLIRDGIFLQTGPAAVALDGRFLVAILLASIGGFLLGERIDRLGKFIAVIDALGLGAYAVVGIEKSLAAGLSVPAALLVGVINACGGGLLRDVLVRDEPLLFRPGQFYAVAAVGGAGLFAVLVLQTSLPVTVAALLAIALTFLLRMLAITFNWRTTPLIEKTPPPVARGGDAR